MRILNLGILAHVDAGKTSLTERLLFETGVIARLGSVDAGNTQTDSLALERQRGITIRAAVASFAMGAITVNLVDTPGHPDFIAEVERTLAVLDAAVVVVSAVEGVQAQTRVLVRALKRLGVPMLFFINKVDRRGADPDAVVAALERQLKLRTVAMSEAPHAGSKDCVVVAADLKEPGFRQRLLDCLIEADGMLFEAAVLDVEAISAARLRQALADQVGQGIVAPAFFGSAATGAGIAALMAGIETLLPAREPDADGPVDGVVFKIERGWGGEKQALVAVRSGSLSLREVVALPKGEERVTGIQLYQGGRQVTAERLAAGQIGRVTGLATAVIGDRIGAGSIAQRGAQFPPPTLETQVLPQRPVDRQALWVALGQLAEADPLINLRHHEDDGAMFVSLYGEVQKEVIGATLEQDFGLPVTFAQSTVICAERPAGSATAAEVMFENGNPSIGLSIAPRATGAGNAFSFTADMGLMPAGFYRAIAEAVEETLRQGISGWAVTDCDVTVTTVAQMAPMSTAADFRQLAPLVLASALQWAGTIVCEPVSRFALDAPVEAMGAMLTLLGQSEAAIAVSDVTEGEAVIRGTLPTRLVQSVQRQLPDLSGGAATLEATFDHYAPVIAGPVRKRIGPDLFDRAAYLARARR